MGRALRQDAAFRAAVVEEARQGWNAKEITDALNCLPVQEAWDCDVEDVQAVLDDLGELRPKNDAPELGQGVLRHRDEFWYRIPGVWYGNSKPYVRGHECTATVDAGRILEAAAYFKAHNRTVRVTETSVAPNQNSHGANGVRICYVWRKDEQGNS